MPIEPIKIPQNVYIEDRIVGPLTLKQVIIVTLGGGFSYAMFASISKAYGFVAIPLQILVWIPALISIIFAFVKINDLSMLRLCMLFLERLNKPSTRTWTPRRGIIINVRTFHTAMEESKTTRTAVVKDGTEQKFDELSTLLDQPRTRRAEESAAPLVPTMPELMTDEPSEHEEEMNPNMQRPRPVDQTRISVSPRQSDEKIDAPTAGSVSLFRDISPSR